LPESGNIEKLMFVFFSKMGILLSAIGAAFFGGDTLQTELKRHIGQLIDCFRGNTLQTKISYDDSPV